MLIGAGSVIDLGAAFEMPKLGDIADDVSALQGDVKVLEGDLEAVLDRHRRQLLQHLDGR